METKTLERFATWARRELINAVDAQATAVLSVGSVVRSEQSEVVKKLEAEIAGHGRQHVVDKVAYTWFNRIIALRFMDTRGYTDAGVVSPAQGQSHGQPEILSDAKRGNLDTDVVTNTRTAEAIIGLLDGTRRSTDAEGEAYALLLTAYCRYWHKSMPFMFEREGDYTELLVPANLLADGAILARAREVLTEGVCEDVEVIGWLYQFYISERKAEVFAGFKNNKKAGADELPAATQLFTPHWIVRYLVENSLGRLWMLNRPASTLIDQMDYYIVPADAEIDFLRISSPEELRLIDPACGSGHMLTYAFDLLYAIYEEEGYAPSKIPSLILTRNLYGAEIDPRAGALAAFALTMKGRAKQRTFFNTEVKPNVCVFDPISFTQYEINFLLSRDGDRRAELTFWNQFVHADSLGSLIQPDPELTISLRKHIARLDDRGEILLTDVLQRAKRVLLQAEYLMPSYSVVVANPPYMGSKNMSSYLVDWVTRVYPDVKADLFSCFFYRSVELTVPRGQMGFMSPFVWMFISSYEKLRDRFTDTQTITSLVQLEYSGFDGATVPICAFTIENSAKNFLAAFVRLHDFIGPKQQGERAREIIHSAADDQAGAVSRFPGMERHFYRATSGSFVDIPGKPIAYWLPTRTREVFKGASLLNSRVEIREGINTGDNNRFLRLWWEVSRTSISFNRTMAGEDSQRWVPHKKGGKFRRWAGNEEYVLDWSSSGERIHEFHGVPLSTNGAPMRGKAFFFKRSLSWSRVSSGAFSIRAYPSGFSYDSTAPSIFGEQDELLRVLGLLNSSIVGSLLQATSPTLDYRITALGRIPLPKDWASMSQTIVDRLVYLSQKDWNAEETSWGFSSSPWSNRLEPDALVEDIWNSVLSDRNAFDDEVSQLELENDRHFAEAYGLEAEVSTRNLPLGGNLGSRDPDLADKTASPAPKYQDAAEDFVSYAVGCMFGRYSIDEPGFILTDQGSTLRDFLVRVPTPTFKPDVDNVIPLVGEDRFEDDIVERFRNFLRVAFGSEKFEKNLKFIEESLRVQTLRDYFITKGGNSKFYEEHVRRYKKRPIYWMFSSPKGSFNALIYMHRYTPSTVSTVLNEYLREYRAKLEVALANAEHSAAVAGGGSAKEQKEADRLRKVLLELAEYEHDVLYPLATQQIVIDLDDGVKANYPKFYPALKNIAGLEATE